MDFKILLCAIDNLRIARDLIGTFELDPELGRTYYEVNELIIYLSDLIEKSLP